jgi:hypothetical protein
MPHLPRTEEKEQEPDHGEKELGAAKAVSQAGISSETSGILRARRFSERTTFRI